jgi:glutathione synthase/RimK-type ligase-like ATP-grasp enzyme
LATARELPRPDDDQEPLLAALAELGVPARVAAWDDPDVDWSAARACVLRSTWNYVRHYPEFLAWVDRCAAATSLWNPAAVVRWNSHKGYLVELAARGLPVVPTRVVTRGTTASLAALAAEWPEVVVKPAISAGSFGTLRVSRDGGNDFARGQAHLDAMLVERDMMVQPYFRSVEEHGERALVWIDGAFSHEVRKSPRFAGDTASISEAQPPGAEEQEVAEQILAAVPAPLLYARIDLARDEAGRPHLMELELIEPALFIASYPPGAARMAVAIRRRL